MLSGPAAFMSLPEILAKLGRRAVTGRFLNAESKRLAVGYPCISEHWSGECLCFRIFNPSMLALSLPWGHDLSIVMYAMTSLEVNTICKAVLTCCRCMVDLVRAQSFLSDAASFMTNLCLP